MPDDVLENHCLTTWFNLTLMFTICLFIVALAICRQLQCITSPDHVALRTQELSCITQLMYSEVSYKQENKFLFKLCKPALYCNSNWISITWSIMTVFIKKHYLHFENLSASREPLHSNKFCKHSMSWSIL